MNNNIKAPEATTTNSIEDVADDDPKKTKSKEETQPSMATVGQVFSFGTAQTPILLFLGAMFACVSGMVGPFMVVYFAKANTELSGDPTTDEFMENIKELAYVFLVLG